jgi:hypothetical protein
MSQEVYQDQEPFYKPDPLAYLEDWVFHFSSFRNEWAAIPRETYTAYWSQYNHPNVLRSKHLNSLLDLLHKSKGDSGIIENLTSGEIK